MARELNDSDREKRSLGIGALKQQFIPRIPVAGGAPIARNRKATCTLVDQSRTFAQT